MGARGHYETVRAKSPRKAFQPSRTVELRQGIDRYTRNAKFRSNSIRRGNPRAQLGQPTNAKKSATVSPFCSDRRYSPCWVVSVMSGARPARDCALVVGNGLEITCQATNKPSPPTTAHNTPRRRAACLLRCGRKLRLLLVPGIDVDRAFIRTWKGKMASNGLDTRSGRRPQTQPVLRQTDARTGARPVLFRRWPLS